MRNSSKSFAHQYGITQKNVISNPSAGIGLNPNLNIEDQYIQNLLKQTHFLNMEIKLMKQKQKQNKGMGIMGLLNKDQNPVVSHAIFSNNKYSEMRNKLGGLVNTVQVEYVKLDDQNFAVKAQRDFVQGQSLKQEQKNIKHKLYVDKQLIQNNDLLRQNQKRLFQIRQQNSKIKSSHDQIFRDWQQLTSKEATKKLFKQINEDLENQFEQLKKRHFQVRNLILKQKQKYLKQDDEKNKQDPTYISLLQEFEDEEIKLVESEKKLFEEGYRVKQMEELKKLAIRNKDFQAESKKQAIDELEKLKKKLLDRKTDFQSKLKESKNNLQANDQIRLLKGKIARKDKQINDIKKKTEISEKNFRNLRDQVERLTGKLQKFKLSNQTHNQRSIALTVSKNQGLSQLNKDQLDNQKLELQIGSTISSLKEKRKQVEELDEELTYLKAKQDYLSKQIDLDEGMKSVKVDQLTSLMHNNTGLNETIKNLMEKWQQIKKFSRQPPVM